MTGPLEITDDLLVSELLARDVRFLMGKQLGAKPTLEPEHLIASLAQSRDARVRMALIPLFLRRPEFSVEVLHADKALSTQSDQAYLRFYYTAAVLLQNKYWESLVNILGTQSRLPDLFSRELGISLAPDPDEALRQLAKHHQVLSGRFINWLETYEHGAKRLIQHMEKFG